jgi:hypothetical protein
VKILHQTHFGKEFGDIPGGVVRTDGPVYDSSSYFYGSSMVFLDSSSFNPSSCFDGKTLRVLGSANALNEVILVNAQDLERIRIAVKEYNAAARKGTESVSPEQPGMEIIE